VLIAGEKGGATAKMVFVGFGIALVHKFLTAACKLWAGEPAAKLAPVGLKGGQIRGELSPELMGVGFLIGPRIASLMMAGAVMSYFVLGPAIATFGEKLTEPVAPAQWDPDKPRDEKNPALIRNMEPEKLRTTYLRYIGAGAVAAGGIIIRMPRMPPRTATVMTRIGSISKPRSKSAGIVTPTPKAIDSPALPVV